MENVSEAENLEEGYIRHNRELRKVRAYIRNVSPKGEFEYLFLEYFDQMEAWADAAVKSLKASGYKQLYQQSIDAGYMVHGEYNYHNIFFRSRIKQNIVVICLLPKLGQQIDAKKNAVVRLLAYNSIFVMR